MAIAKPAEQRVGCALEGAARMLAYTGGLILVGMALITVVSIIGRALNSFGLGPITGDFELVEAGCAIAVFAFLPWCQLKRGHVRVDVVIDRFGPRIVAVFGLMGDLMIAIIAWLIFWRFFLGLGEKFPYGSDALRACFGIGSRPLFLETTYELELPIWIPFGFALIGAALFFVVSVFTVWRALNWVLDGKESKV